MKEIISFKKRDFYYHLLESSWPKLIFIIISFYIIVNIIFSLIYYNIGEGISNFSGTLMDAFFFSIQTMSTIGYGFMAPTSLATNLVVVFQSTFGLISLAGITGIIFAKISRPHAKIIFSKNILYTTINDKRVLTFRIANARGNDIVEANLNASVLIKEVTPEGESFLKIHTMKLSREKTPFFKLSWVVFHEINDDSPLQNVSIDDPCLKAIAITITGHDSTYSSTIYSRYNYNPTDIMKDRYFVDIMSEGADGEMMIDYSKFHDLK